MQLKFSAVSFPRVSAMLLIGAFLCAVASAETPKAEVTIAKDAPLEAALAALQRSTGGAVLAQTLTVDRFHPEGLTEVASGQAAEEISTWYHLYEIRRPGSHVFQRRYGDPREEIEIDLEEASAAFTDLARLVQPFVLWPTDRTLTTDRRDFIRTLSREQVRAMQSEAGLAFAQLRPDQRTLWLKINTRQAYSGKDTWAFRSASALSNWRRAEFGYLTRPVQVPGGAIETRTSLRFIFPSATSPGEIATIGLPEPTPSEHQFDPPTVPFGEIHVSARAGLPEAFRARVQIEDGETKLTALVAALEEATERQITLPGYARERRLLAFVSGATAQEVVGALEDLYDWRLQHQEGRRYALRRPSFPAGEGHLDVYRKMRAALVPAGKRLLDEFPLGSRNARYQRTMEPLYAACTRQYGRGWKPVRVAEMEPDLQKLLLALVFDQLLGGGSTFLNGPDPRWWLVEPQHGFFTMVGDPGGNPQVEFNVRRPDGSLDGWGWSAGTNNFGG
jgi:hypothetical protein